MATVQSSVDAQSAALVAAADEILATPRVAQRRFVPLSSAEAVIRYWSDFVPSWAGAISIDLLPVVLVLVLMIVNDAMRREAESLKEAETITAAEMLRAMALYKRMEAEGAAEAAEVLGMQDEQNDETPNEAAPDGAVKPEEGTVTPIEAAQRKRGEGPRQT